MKIQVHIGMPSSNNGRRSSAPPGDRGSRNIKLFLRAGFLDELGKFGMVSFAG